MWLKMTIPITYPRPYKGEEILNMGPWYFHSKQRGCFPIVVANKPRMNNSCRKCRSSHCCWRIPSQVTNLSHTFCNRMKSLPSSITQHNRVFLLSKFWEIRDTSSDDPTFCQTKFRAKNLQSFWQMQDSHRSILFRAIEWKMVNVIFNNEWIKEFYFSMVKAL